jgi:putative FmdB family regulatory protein
LPRYTYECTKCGHAYEKLEGWDAKPKQRCPKCRATSQRIPVSPSIVFKGSGWYSTDNRRTLRDGADKPDQGKSSNNGEDSGGQSSDEGSTPDNGSTSGKKASSGAKSSASGGDD